jgi:exonuclease SbcC
MRPVRLTLRGFTSFREEATVDFTSLDRFAICGPTGAGKSSLLDAMTFALFANCPRIGHGSLTDLVALCSNKFTVTLDFRARGRLYRVTRFRRRAGGSGDQLEMLKEGTTEVPELVASGADEVTREVERLLGLNYEHFTQAVFLPQGQFAEFLHGQPRERRKLLNELLRLLVFERMRESAGREREDLARRTEQIRDRLEADFAGATAEACAELERRQAEQRAAEEEAGGRLPGLQERRDLLRRERTLTAEVEAKQQELDQLRQQQPEIDRARREAEAGSRAAGVIPLLDQSDRAGGEDGRRREALAQANLAVAGLGEEHRAARTDLERAAGEAAPLDALRQRGERLAEAVGRVGHRDQLAGRVEELTRLYAGLAAEHRVKAGQFQLLDDQAAGLSADLDRARAELVALPYDEARHRRLEAEREEAVHLRGERKQWTEAEQRAALAEAAAQAAEIEAEKAREAAHLAEEARRQAAGRNEDADGALRAAEDAHRAAHLRAGLRRGEACPVCRQDVVRLPAGEPAPELEECRKAAQAAAAALRHVERSASEKAVAQASAETAAAAARDQAGADWEGAERRRKAVTQQERSLAARVGKPLGDPAAQPIEERVLDAVRLAGVLAGQHRKASERLAKLRERAAVNDEARKGLAKEISRIDDQLGTVADATARDQAALERVRQEIREAAGTDDPAAERDGIQAEIGRLQRQLEQATLAEAGVRNRLDVARAGAETCAREATAAEGLAQEAAAVAAGALQRAGFDGPAAARAACRSPEQLRALGERVQDHDGRVNTLTSRVAELERELRARRVSEEEARQADAELAACLGAKQEAGRQAVLLAHEIEAMKKRIERAEELRRELGEQEQQYRIFDHLASDLRSDRFQEYLLEETLADLVRDASAQLARLTGDRYGLQFQDGRILVVDYDNAGELRGVDTFSGGETFLASLALALALSAQVQKAIGAVHLDCLFIDEGFGTLDPETLRTASDAIRGLQVGGRMVGIITHIPDLRQEFEQRLIVVKEGNVSSVQVEVA